MALSIPPVKSHWLGTCAWSECHVAQFFKMPSITCCLFRNFPDGWWAVVIEMLRDPCPKMPVHSMKCWDELWLKFRQSCLSFVYQTNSREQVNNMNLNCCDHKRPSSRMTIFWCGCHVTRRRFSRNRRLQTSPPFGKNRQGRMTGLTSWMNDCIDQNNTILSLSHGIDELKSSPVSLSRGTYSFVLACTSRF
jgi:hypothetical protein